jgi:hypothetical protein
MTTFTINQQNQIVAFATQEEAAAATQTPFDSFTNQQELVELAVAWPADRLVATWNNLPGVTPVKKFKDRKTALTRIWKQLQQPDASSQPKAEQKAKGGAQAAKGAPAKAKATKAATVGKNAPKATKAARSQEAAAPRQGSKAATVLAMLQRKNGATLNEIAQKMGWQRHTVRGFIAGAMKKAGHVVESFKPAGGERSYRISH